jgi:hypothetical protein
MAPASWRKPTALVHSARQISGEALWRAAYRRWEPATTDAELVPGYSLLMPVPSDLPVFLRLALANVAAQDPTGRAEILVIPDRPSAAIARAFDACKAELGVADLRLVELNAMGRALGRLSSDPGTNHFLQLHAGVTETATAHALLHDADLFLTDQHFLARHYRRCAERGLACLGVSPAWDDWLRDHGFGHVVATWELMFDVRWMRSIPPWRHRWHHERVHGEWHGFDLTLYSQARTSPERCELDPGADDSFVHFNWVISAYRNFQRSRGRPMEDDRFTMLLIRLLTDALDHGRNGSQSRTIDVPDVAELTRGLTDPSQRVTYCADETRANYAAFRDKVSHLYRAPLFDDRAVEVIEERLAAFDTAFG